MFKLSMWVKKVSVVVILVLLVLSTVVAVHFFVNRVNLTRVACLGDSITESYGYPEYLQVLLGEGSTVANFGATRVTVNLQSSDPYYYKLDFQELKDFNPTTVVLMLGTNDVRIDNCLKVDTFVDDYKFLISKIQNQTSASSIFLVIPPPVFDNGVELNCTFLSDKIIPCIQQVADEENLPLIDLYTPMFDCSEHFFDGVHPDKVGVQIITQIIYDTIKAY